MSIADVWPLAFALVYYEHQTLPELQNVGALLRIGARCMMPGMAPERPEERAHCRSMLWI